VDYSNLANIVLNNAASIDATLSLLLQKGLITQAEYDEAKEKSVKKIKMELGEVRKES